MGEVFQIYHAAQSAMLAQHVEHELRHLTLSHLLQFHTGDNEYKVLDGMVAAARQVVNATPKLAELKVTFNLGKVLCTIMLCTSHNAAMSRHVA